MNITVFHRRDIMDYDNLKIEGGFENDILILRDALMAELDALNLYEKMLVGLKVEKAKAYVKRFIEEEKQHVAALTKLINEMDTDQKNKFDDDDYCNAIYDGQCVL
jgi:rubrerythrin